ncbi:hypothetical protein Scep_023844 [Stephania cephalantha]|uniref:Uncharacterized protein n=1 Tax=Stephania cephalantha TaxID=152367 RepID=A0AAP0EVX8_9MAGN
MTYAEELFSLSIDDDVDVWRGVFDENVEYGVKMKKLRHFYKHYLTGENQ